MLAPGDDYVCMYLCNNSSKKLMKNIYPEGILNRDFYADFFLSLSLFLSVKTLVNIFGTEVRTIKLKYFALFPSESACPV